MKVTARVYAEVCAGYWNSEQEQTFGFGRISCQIQLLCSTKLQPVVESMWELSWAGISEKHVMHFQSASRKPVPIWTLE